MTAGDNVSRLNSRTILKSTWDMVRRISGKYKANTVSHLKYNNNDITDVKDICNTLANNLLLILNLKIIVIGLIDTDYQLREGKLILIRTIIIHITN